MLEMGSKSKKATFYKSKKNTSKYFFTEIYTGFDFGAGKINHFGQL
jgi:hypothetical protein